MKHALLLSLLVSLFTGYSIAQDSDTTESSAEAGSGLEGAMEREKDAVAEQWAEPQIRRQDDEFSGHSGTELSMRLRDFSDEVRLRLQYVTRKGTSSNAYFAVADLVLSDWLFVDEIYFLADGERYNLESMSDESTTDVVNSNTVREWVVFSLTPSMVQTMASADEVRLSLRGDRGRRDYTLREIDVEKLREFAEITGDNS